MLRRQGRQRSCRRRHYLVDQQQQQPPHHRVPVSSIQPVDRRKIVLASCQAFGSHSEGPRQKGSPDSWLWYTLSLSDYHCAWQVPPADAGLHSNRWVAGCTTGGSVPPSACGRPLTDLASRRQHAIGLGLGRIATVFWKPTASTGRMVASRNTRIGPPCDTVGNAEGVPEAVDERASKRLRKAFPFVTWSGVDRFFPTTIFNIYCCGQTKH
jgi:hypothetical protein